MAASFLVVPGVPIAAGLIGAAVYTLILLSAPGVIRDLARDVLAGVRA
jgi:hypothetical protein